ncbi:unnamed protein product [Owenia fusiformis]|uniref:Uncharacterized protein n=1 Tax=Owenia fusiformis TaxID=6347 RepID=A0A8J1U0I1_OWEFU|nr:unnamed protein product [Owenia fusiformis]
MAENFLKNAKGIHYGYGKENYKEGVPLLPAFHPDVFTESLANFKMFPDDIYFTGYMRTGTYIGLEVLQLILNDVDTETLRNTPIYDRIYHILVGRDYFIPGKLKGFEHGESPLPWLSEQKSPRLLKTHGLYEFAPKDAKTGKCKVIVATRNPKSTYLSWFKLMQTFTPVFPDGITWEDYFAAMISGENKHLVLGTWFDFCLDWWKHRDDMSIFFLNYEALFKDGRKVIKELTEFLGKTLTEEKITEILKYIDFDQCKQNPSFSKALKNMPMASEKTSHMRKGKIDDWKNYFTVAQSEQFDKLYKEKMEGSGFPEPVYE